MIKRTVFACTLASSIIGLSAASSADEDVALPKELAKYEITGETRRCVKTVNISRSDPLDDRHILFKLRNGDLYLNRLGKGCGGLRFNDAYSFDNRLSELCQNEIISVLDTFNSGTLGSCGLGKFEKLELKNQSTEG